MKTQADIRALSSNISTIQTNIQQLTQKTATIDQAITTMNQTIQDEFKKMQELEIKRQIIIKPKKQRHVHRPIHTMEKLYIQAIIPGRAWLIRKNGTDTITVREGTKVPGHGVVQVIDPNQGRVTLSSGEIITFGQWDS